LVIAIPDDFDSLAIPRVLQNRARCLDPHHGNGLSSNIEGKAMFLYKRRLDSYPITRLNAFDLFKEFLVIAVFPNLAIYLTPPTTRCSGV
jgi:hypothetical protein